MLILRRLPELGSHLAIVTGTSINRRSVVLQPIYDKLGPKICSALPGFHSISGEDIRGRILGVGKKTAFKVLLKCPPSVLSALTQVDSDSILPLEVISGCEQLLFMVISSKTVASMSPAILRWRQIQKLSSSQNVHMLPPTAGTWFHHIYRAHLQADIWAHDKVLHPSVPDPCELCWVKQDGRYRPIFSVDPVSCTRPRQSLRKCNCGVSFCSRRCT